MRSIGWTVLVAALLLGSATSALAQEETTTTTPPAQPAVTVQPAVVAEPAPVKEILPDWTYRYLVPAGLVLAALLILVTVVQYFVQVVRKRYRVVR
jgi:hypothetical protein